MYRTADLPAGRNNEAFIKLNGKRKAFFKGSNSTCRFHIRQHYEVYKEKCEKEDIPMSHWAIPRPIWKAMEEEKEEQERGRSTKKQMQQKLDFKARHNSKLRSSSPQKNCKLLTTCLSRQPQE